MSIKTLAITTLSLLLLTTASQASDPFVYFGTYTRGKDAISKGIYVSRINLETGALTKPELAAEANSPSFLEIHPSKQYLYAVSEIGGDGAVAAYKIDQTTGKLTLINKQSTGGAGPCHVNLDSAGTMLMVANYSGGSCASFPINRDGSLGEIASFIQHEGSSVNEKRQKAPHAHSINPGPRDQFSFVADLGTDEVVIYKIDPATAKMTPHSTAKVAPGSGPRHFTFYPGGSYAYVINEMTLTVTGFKWNQQEGTLTEIQTISTIPTEDQGKPGQSTAEIRVHPTGKFLYGSNRGHDTIAVFSIDRYTGLLKHVENEPTRSETPRNFNLTPDGKWLLAAGQKSNTVSVFKIDPETGALEFVNQEIEVGSPVCIRFLSIWTEDESR